MSERDLRPENEQAKIAFARFVTRAKFRYRLNIGIGILIFIAGLIAENIFMECPRYVVKTLYIFSGLYILYGYFLRKHLMEVVHSGELTDVADAAAEQNNNTSLTEKHSPL